MPSGQTATRAEDQPEIIPFPNGDFEDGETGWSINKTRGECGLITENTGSGKYALKIKATAANNGARVDGPLVPCGRAGLIEIYGSIRSVSGRAVDMRVYQLDTDGNILPDEFWMPMEAEDGVWHRHELLGVMVLPARTASLRVTLLAYPTGSQVIEVYVDDLQFVRPPLRIPPLPPQYKLAPDDTVKLTPADVVGPDGVVYPNWTQVGVQGGIPDVPVVLKLADRGAKPETDISGLLQEACRTVGEQGGGAILIGEGTFYLDNPVLIRHSGVVIRGAGRLQTHLIFRYSLVYPQPPGRQPNPGAVFMFRGDMEQREYLLATDARRGDMALTVVPGHDLEAGDKVVLRAPDTERWQALVNHRGRQVWGRRVNEYLVGAVSGNTLTLTQPLRIDFPVADGSCLRRIQAVERCGVEDMSIKHACRMEFDTVSSNFAWNCWVRRMDGIDCGKSGVHFVASKWCEVRDCEFTGFDAAVHIAHTNWGGYAGFTQSADCLMENTVWHRFRHGPIVQFGAQGNVIRNSVFIGSDAQWHAGWSTENLFENCIIDAHGEYGTYGYGAYATGSHDGGHGPNGPRNVVYGCDFKSPRDGVMLCGVNENWLFLHNRFVVEKGAGFVGLCGAFDHIIRHNVFILRDGASPMLRFRTADCTGVDLIDNTLVGGNGTAYEGLPALDVERGNRVLPLSAAVPDRPVADPPSIYEWQQQNRRRIIQKC